MIISEATYIDAHDVEQFAWSGLRRFSNVNAVSKRIIDRFKLPSKQHENARKQAQQLAFCLSQAVEYFGAAETASLATRPVQLYYGCMSLALAEILWKADGNFSLDKLRSGNAQHGLSLKQGPSNDIYVLATAALVGAKIDDRGTFVVWVKFCRNHPLVGIRTVKHPNGTTSAGPAALYMAEDRASVVFPAEGINLLECVKSLPTMFGTVARFGHVPHLVRAKIERSCITDAQTGRIREHDTLTIHPADQQKIAEVEREITFVPPIQDRVKRTDFASGFVMNYWRDQGDPGAHFPEGSSIDEETTYLRPASITLNEFGYFYVAFYIAGMFCRYYPDVWMRHLAEHTDLSLLIERLCAEASVRVPLLTLCDLEQMLYIRKK